MTEDKTEEGSLLSSGSAGQKKNQQTFLKVFVSIIAMVIVFGSIVFAVVYVQKASSGANQCAKQNGGCEHLCRSYGDFFNCSCHSGYTIADDGKSCIETY
ncbi:dorsal-ventral patterning protein tolloid-like [Ptychodera flava]|uniref:dorsal-ventral patterning protein tolloid-like n=1 Tax=Ptychodera flava TaxID=63121 RepID=UPI00396A0A81